MAWFSLTEPELLAEHARRGLERHIKIGEEDKAGITWFHTITKFMFANETTLAKSTAGRKKKKRSRTESTQEISDENCRRGSRKTGKTQRQESWRSAERTHVGSAAGVRCSQRGCT